MARNVSGGDLPLTGKIGQTSSRRAFIKNIHDYYGIVSFAACQVKPWQKHGNRVPRSFARAGIRLGAPFRQMFSI